MTADDFTEAARAEAERYWLCGPDVPSDDPDAPSDEEMCLHMAEWARGYLAAQESTDAMQIIDQHRQDGRSVGYGVTVHCACGAESWGYIDGSRPIDDENNSHRVADRKHAAHVADALSAARAARRDMEEQS